MNVPFQFSKFYHLNHNKNEAKIFRNINWPWWPSGLRQQIHKFKKGMSSVDPGSNIAWA